MPLINLIPPQILEKRRRELLAIRLGVAIGVSLFFGFSINAYLEAKIRSLRTNIAQEDRLIAELEVKLAELRRIEEENKAIKGRISVLEGLIKGRVKYAILLDRLLSHITPNIWLTNLSFSENRIDLSAIAKSNYDIADFMVSLMDSGIFHNVELKSISNTTVEEVEVKSFSLGFEYTV